LTKKREYLRVTGYPDENPDMMFPWDLPFYTRLVEEESNLDQDMIAEYFPLQNTVASMLDIFAHCLQLRFEKLPEKTHSTWHEDVDIWSVWDERTEEEGEFIGYLYADLLFRPNKYRGSQDVNLQCVSLIFDTVFAGTAILCYTC
jgi:metallopeptidase MepB